MRKVTKILLLLFLVFTLVGCANDASSNEKSKILKALTKKGYIESKYKKVGSSKVKTGSFDATPLYDHYDVYEINGKLYSFNFDKIYFRDEKETKKCDFIITIYSEVELLKNQEVEEYNSETKEYEIVIKDVYNTDPGTYKKYCVNNKKYILGIINKYQVEEY